MGRRSRAGQETLAPLDYASADLPKRKFPWIPAFFGVVILIGLGTIFLPPLLNPCCRSTETGRRVRCAANMKALGNTIALYALAHQGQFPDSIETLLRAQPEETSSLSLLICPTTDDEAYDDSDRQVSINKLYERGNPSSFSLSQSRPWLHISYVYAGRGMSTQTSPDAIVMYETISNHDGDGMNVLFADGHVDYFMKRDVVKMVAEVQAGHNPPRAEMLK